MKHYKVKMIQEYIKDDIKKSSSKFATSFLKVLHALWRYQKISSESREVEALSSIS